MKFSGLRAVPGAVAIRAPTHSSTTVTSAPKLSEMGGESRASRCQRTMPRANRPAASAKRPRS